MPIVSVVIPSRNRFNEVKATVTNILNSVNPDFAIEIIISDNSDTPYPEITIDTRVRVVRAEHRLLTAEENLFYALPHARGNYLFPLGDDDILIRESLLSLLQMCKEENYDAMVWNCRNVTSNYEPMGWSRVVCYSPVLETTYESFLERIGFWSIPASVSLCVFRRELLTEAALSDVRNFRSKIYSHVSLYAILFKNRKFAFINQDLVLYRTNAYDLSHKDTDHWTNYSSSQGFADKFFWNLGFVEQLQFLAANGSLKKDFLKRSIDIGHFGHRLTLLEHVISLMLEQVENDLMGASKIELSSKDLEALLDYFEEIEPKYLGFILSMRELNRVRNSDKKRALRMLDDLKNSFEKSRSSYPFNRFYHSRLFGFLIYDTPLGWLALPQGIASFLNSNPIPLHLAEMLLGIEFPNLEGQYHADSLAELTNKISKLKISGAQIDALNVFHHATAVYKERNSRATTSLVRQVWNRLPLKVKINLKNYLTK